METKGWNAFPIINNLIKFTPLKRGIFIIYFYMKTNSIKDRIEQNNLILPHGTHVGSQVIKNNKEPKKFESQKTSNDIFISRYKEFVEKVKILEQDYEINNEVYNSTYSFEPIIGQVYHLYLKKNGDKFLSIISPSEWGQEYLYSVILNSDKIWVKV